jgi:hypothetical protein
MCGGKLLRSKRARRFRRGSSSALIFALAATAANAQTPQPVPPAAAPGPAAKILPSTPSEAMTVTHWYKQTVYDPSDAKIGDQKPH